MGVLQDLKKEAPKRLPCPDCKVVSMRRISRKGFLQKRVLSLFGLYPWECYQCREIRMLHERGMRKRRSDRDRDDEHNGESEAPGELPTA